MIEQALDQLARWLMQADAGLGLVALVGLSMSLSHLFALVANRLTPRQVVSQLILDALVLATPGFVVALLLVVAVFHQGWQRAYRQLASTLAPTAES